MGKAKTEFIPLANIALDQRVNREPKQNQVDQIVSSFVPDAIGVVILSERPDGTYVPIDGQHRILALQQLSPNGSARVEAKVMRGLSVEQEAGLFVHYNRHLGVTPLERYLKGVTARDPKYVAIDKTVRSIGLRVTWSARMPGAIRCASALEKIYENFGEIHLRTVLATLQAAFGQTPEAFKHPVVLGMSAFLGRWGARVDLDVLVKKLAPFKGGASGLLGAARGASSIHGSTLAHNVAGVITATYNTRRRANSLPDWWSN